MSLVRKFEFPSISRSNDENALSVLGNAKLCGINDLPHRLIASAVFRVDPLYASKKALQTLSLVLVCQPGHILQQQAAR